MADFDIRKVLTPEYANNTLAEFSSQQPLTTEEYEKLLLIFESKKTLLLIKDSHYCTNRLCAEVIRMRSEAKINQPMAMKF